jgi:hypothetical protein
MRNPIAVAGDRVFNALVKSGCKSPYAREIACLGFDISTLYTITYIVKKILYPPLTL